MASSEVSICNQALGWLGEKLIISLSDPSVAAQLCKLNYAPLRDALIESRDWAFAMKRVSLAKLAAVPSWGYAQQFQVPADLLRLIWVGADAQLEEVNPVDNWQREGDKIMANASTVYIRYLYGVSDVGLFPPMFVQALAARLAADLAMPITNSRALQRDMFGLFESKMSEAGVSDAMQGRTRVIRSQDLSVRARLGGAFLGR